MKFSIFSHVGGDVTWWRDRLPRLRVCTWKGYEQNMFVIGSSPRACVTRRSASLVLLLLIPSFNVFLCESNTFFFFEFTMIKQQQQQQQQQQQHGHVEVGGVLPVETDTLLLAATHKIPSNENDDSVTMFQDPIFLAMISWLGMKTTDTALLGHVSADALAAAALSDLWTMCTAVLIQGRVLGILVGGALGAGNPKLGGIYLQVSLVVLSGVSVIVFIAWNCTEQVWVAFGSNVDIAADAGYYARILSLSIPGMHLTIMIEYIHYILHE